MTTEALAACWAKRLHATPEAFERPGVTVVGRKGFDAVVSVLLRQACVVAAPHPLVPLLSTLTADQLLDADTLAVRIDESGVEAVSWVALGSADLWTTASTPQTGPLPTRPATAEEVAGFGSGVPASDWDEGGLEPMPRRWATLQNGRVTALAGYEVWPGGVAHLGVLTAPDHRGRGAGRTVAAAAVTDALAAGLTPQWRCRKGNLPSAALAARLGFVRVGRQTAVARHGG